MIEVERGGNLPYLIPKGVSGLRRRLGPGVFKGIVPRGPILRPGTVVVEKVADPMQEIKEAI